LTALEVWGTNVPAVEDGFNICRSPVRKIIQRSRIQAVSFKTEEGRLHNIPRYCSLDGFTELSSTLDGLALRTLAPFDLVCARTLNNDYYIFLLEPETGKAYVQGGRYFSKPVEATVSGSTFGGCMLKMGWLGIGLRIEICAEGQRIVTSPVKSLHVEHAEN
jgi:hypothetical protein